MNRTGSSPELTAICLVACILLLPGMLGAQTQADLAGIAVSELSLDSLRTEIEWIHRDVARQYVHYQNTLSTIQTVAGLVIGGVLSLNIFGLLGLYLSEKRVLRKDFEATAKELENRYSVPLLKLQWDLDQYLQYMTKSLGGRTLLIQFFTSGKTITRPDDPNQRAAALLITNAFSSFVWAIGYLLQVQNVTPTLRAFYLDSLQGISACIQTPFQAQHMFQPDIQILRTNISGLKSYSAWEKDADIQKLVKDIEKWLDD